MSQRLKVGFRSCHKFSHLMKSQKKKTRAAPAVIRNNAKLTVVFKTGNSLLIDFDRAYGNLRTLNGDWRLNSTQGTPKEYSYQAEGVSSGTLTVIFAQVMAVQEAYL